MRCECGCGWEGEDPVTQLLLEETAFVLLELVESRARSAALEEQERAARLEAMHDRVLS